MVAHQLTSERHHSYKRSRTEQSYVASTLPATPTAVQRSRGIWSPSITTYNLPDEHLLQPHTSCAEKTRQLCFPVPAGIPSCDAHLTSLFSASCHSTLPNKQARPFGEYMAHKFEHPRHDLQRHSGLLAADTSLLSHVTGTVPSTDQVPRQTQHTLPSKGTARLQDEEQKGCESPGSRVHRLHWQVCHQRAHKERL